MNRLMEAGDEFIPIKSDPL